MPLFTLFDVHADWRQDLQTQEVIDWFADWWRHQGVLVSSSHLLRSIEGTGGGDALRSARRGAKPGDPAVAYEPRPHRWARLANLPVWVGDASQRLIEEVRPGRPPVRAQVMMTGPYWESTELKELFERLCMCYENLTLIDRYVLSRDREGARRTLAALLGEGRVRRLRVLCGPPDKPSKKVDPRDRAKELHAQGKMRIELHVIENASELRPWIHDRFMIFHQDEQSRGIALSVGPGVGLFDKHKDPQKHRQYVIARIPPTYTQDLEHLLSRAPGTRRAVLNERGEWTETTSAGAKPMTRRAQPFDAS